MKKMDMFFSMFLNMLHMESFQIEHLINNLQAAEFKFQILKKINRTLFCGNHQTKINQVGTHLGDLGDRDGIQNAA